jgi:hypothetical protein
MLGDRFDFLFDRDRAFLKSIGIDYQGQPSHMERTYLGQAIIENDATIDLSVLVMPASFWYAEILTVEGKQYSLSTGSGYLSAFWPSFVLVAKGMLSIREKSS